ncbi:MAG: hypothetical protein ACHQNT_02665 [Bacteroidia bacterium]
MKTQFLTDYKGKKLGVFLSIRDYQKLLEESDELACIAAYDKAKKNKPEFISSEIAFKEIENNRKRK